MFYHASPIANIEILEPRISDHDVPLVYFSAKRENVLVYLSNAVEKYCKETGFSYNGNWSKWGPYGFDQSGKLVMEEYYPNALFETYAGVEGYIYSVKDNKNLIAKPEIPDCVVSKKPVPVETAECIPNAYEAILQAEKEGKIGIVRYEENSLVNGKTGFERLSKVSTKVRWNIRNIVIFYKENSGGIWRTNG